MDLVHMDNRNHSANVLIHLHMPKTGGTTLKKIIKRNYDSRKSVDVYEEHHKLPGIFKGLSKQNIECVQGHLPFGVHEYFNRPTTYITMLRDPVDRVISEYYFIRNIEWHNLHESVMKMSLEEYQGLPKNRNLQTRYILGGQLTSVTEVNRAKNILKNHFAVVGLTEKFDTSLFLMKEMFNWKQVAYQKYNVTKKRRSKEEISPKLLEKIAKNNEADLELYAFAKELLAKRIRALDPLSAYRLKRFERKHQQGFHGKRDR
ncbi:sulfotransferase family protein [Halalkalibacterium halodurans]|nr:sulfotransferase family protein [Halalkalibacterium halodurans]